MGGGKGEQEVIFNRSINSDGHRDYSLKSGILIANLAPGA